jgi:hypothetical protein
MFMSRSEYRPLRLDNAEERLEPYGFQPRSRGLPRSVTSPAVLRLGQQRRELPRARFSGLISSRGFSRMLAR